MEPVTVVIPTYERPAMLAEAVGAALRAGASRVVAVDDAADPPARVARDPRVELVRHPRNRGVSAARNRGLERAATPFVLFCDDDDLLHRDALTVLVRALARHPEAAVAIGRREREVHGSPRALPHPLRPLLHDAWLDLVASWSAVPGQTLFRTQAVRDAGGWQDRQPVEDRDLLLRLAERGPFAFVPDVVLTYRAPIGRWEDEEHERRRRDVVQRSIARVSASRRRRARRAARAGVDLRDAERALRGPQRATTLANVARALARHPGMVRSPLLWPRAAWAIRAALGARDG